MLHVLCPAENCPSSILQGDKCLPQAVPASYYRDASSGASQPSLKYLAAPVLLSRNYFTTRTVRVSRAALLNIYEAAETAFHLLPVLVWEREYLGNKEELTECESLDHSLPCLLQSVLVGGTDGEPEDLHLSHWLHPFHVCWPIFLPPPSS